MYQLFVERDESQTSPPTVQELFEKSFQESNLKFKRAPKILILQMPRYGVKYKVFDKILPTRFLDITDFIATNTGEKRVFYWNPKTCNTCNNSSFSIDKYLTFLETKNLEKNERRCLELYAVLCIETSHYVAFVKCGTESNSPWCFFDSMADRIGT